MSQALGQGVRQPNVLVTAMLHDERREILQREPLLAEDPASCLPRTLLLFAGVGVHAGDKGGRWNSRDTGAGTWSDRQGGSLIGGRKGA
ncbi:MULTISPECIES: hypothetical protein [unclassified Streptomyces]|uniref:hypothetical protein n=1 Tax=unclassified Streptomyces TaxID=2593676 RepID=UPI0033A29375